MKVVCINGMPKSGKDTFCYLCKDEYDSFLCRSYSTVNFVKNLARLAGWNGEKTPRNREFLSDLKDLLTNWADVPFQKTLEYIDEVKAEINLLGENIDKAVVFIHVREPKEIQRFVDAIGARTLLIHRPEVESCAQSNHADAEVFCYDYDDVIVNDGTIDDLREKAKNYLDLLFE